MLKSREGGQKKLIKNVHLKLYNNAVNRTDLPIDAMIKFETRAPMRSVRRGQSLIILWWAAALFENFPTQKNKSDIWILGIGFALMNSPYCWTPL